MPVDYKRYYEGEGFEKKIAQKEVSLFKIAKGGPEFPWKFLLLFFVVFISIFSAAYLLFPSYFKASAKEEVAASQAGSSVGIGSVELSGGDSDYSEISLPTEALSDGSVNVTQNVRIAGQERVEFAQVDSDSQITVFQLVPKKVAETAGEIKLNFDAQVVKDDPILAVNLPAGTSRLTMNSDAKTGSNVFSSFVVCKPRLDAAQFESLKNAINFIPFESYSAEKTKGVARDVTSICAGSGNFDSKINAINEYVSGLVSPTAFEAREPALGRPADVLSPEIDFSIGAADIPFSSASDLQGDSTSDANSRDAVIFDFLPAFFSNFSVDFPTYPGKTRCDSIKIAPYKFDDALGEEVNLPAYSLSCDSAALFEDESNSSRSMLQLELGFFNRFKGGLLDFDGAEITVTFSNIGVSLETAKIVEKFNVFALHFAEENEYVSFVPGIFSSNSSAASYFSAGSNDASNAHLVLNNYPFSIDNFELSGNKISLPPYSRAFFDAQNGIGAGENLQARQNGQSFDYLTVAPPADELLDFDTCSFYGNYSPSLFSCANEFCSCVELQNAANAFATKFVCDSLMLTPQDFKHFFKTDVFQKSAVFRTAPVPSMFEPDSCQFENSYSDVFNFTKLSLQPGKTYLVTLKGKIDEIPLGGSIEAREISPNLKLNGAVENK